MLDLIKLRRFMPEILMKKMNTFHSTNIQLVMHIFLSQILYSKHFSKLLKSSKITQQPPSWSVNN